MSKGEEGRNVNSIPEQVGVAEVNFLAEQDGGPERELKRELVELFKRSTNLEEAFLVRVQYDRSSTVRVALCLSTPHEDAQMAQDAALIFYRMFGAHESLDIMFLTPEQQLRIARVARPFYSQVTFSG